MKFVAAILLLAVTAASAQTYVRPHFRKDGTFVEGHYRTAPNGTTIDNYSTKGNYNPYNGKDGTVDPYKVPTTPSYPQQRTCYFNASYQVVCN